MQLFILTCFSDIETRALTAIGAPSSNGMQSNQQHHTSPLLLYNGDNLSHSNPQLIIEMQEDLSLRLEVVQRYPSMPDLPFNHQAVQQKHLSDVLESCTSLYFGIPKAMGVFEELKGGPYGKLQVTDRQDLASRIQFCRLVRVVETLAEVKDNFPRV